jgi:6-pyruvoyl-tetrahydropterin synthase
VDEYKGGTRDNGETREERVSQMTMNFYDTKQLVKKVVEKADDRVVIEKEGDVELRLEMIEFYHNNFEVEWLSVDTEHMSVYYDGKAKTLYVVVQHNDLYLNYHKEIDELEMNLDDVTTFMMNPVLYAKMLVWKNLDLSLYQLGILLTVDS